MYTFFLVIILFIDQGLLNLLIISRSHTKSQMGYVGFETIGSKASQMNYNKYITREQT